MKSLLIKDTTKEERMVNAVLPVTISKKYMPELIGNTKNVFATQMHWISMISS